MHSFGYFWESFWDQFDLANDISFTVEDFSICVQLLACAIFELAFREFGDRFSVFVKDFSLLVDFKALQDIQTRQLGNLWRSFVSSIPGLLTSLFASFLGFISSGFKLLRKLWMKCFHCLVGSLARDDLNFADNITIVIDNKALVVGYLTSASGWVGVVCEFTDNLAFFVEDVALLVDLLTS